jgi:hypothetical protein
MSWLNLSVRGDSSIDKNHIIEGKSYVEEKEERRKVGGDPDKTG